MAFTLPALPYAYDALEPHIDAKTMEIHHDKHHQAYVNNLNAAIEKAPSSQANRSTTDARHQHRSRSHSHRRAQQRRRALEPLAVLAVMGPGKGGEPSGKLADAIKSAFGDFSEFQGAVRRRGRRAFGSAGPGWSQRRQAVDLHTPNQDNPLMDGKPRPRPRRLGACLLPEVPESAARLRRGVVEHHQLGRGRQPLRLITVI